MPSVGGLGHETKLKKVIASLKDQGIKVIDLEAKSPDAIAFIDGKLVAIEVLSHPKGNKLDKTIAAKKKAYHMFDDIVFIHFWNRPYDQFAEHLHLEKRQPMEHMELRQ